MIGQIIKRYIEIRGVDAGDIAGATGIEPPRLAAMLAGDEPIGFEDYAAMCRYLEVPIDMFTDADAREKK